MQLHLKSLPCNGELCQTWGDVSAAVVQLVISKEQEKITNLIWFVNLAVHHVCIKRIYIFRLCWGMVWSRAPQHDVIHLLVCTFCWQSPHPFCRSFFILFLFYLHVHMFLYFLIIFLFSRTCSFERTKLKVATAEDSVTQVLGIPGSWNFCNI